MQTCTKHFDRVERQLPTLVQCRYYVDALYIEPEAIRRPSAKQALGAEELLREAEEQAGLDEASICLGIHNPGGETFRIILASKLFNSSNTISVCRYSCWMQRVSDDMWLPLRER